MSGSGTLLLAWRILRDNGTQFGSDHTYTSSSSNQGPGTIGGVFAVERVSYSPDLISNISFTAQSSINRYAVICEDGITLENKNFTINISGNFNNANGKMLILSYVLTVNCFSYHSSLIFKCHKEINQPF